MILKTKNKPLQDYIAMTVILLMAIGAVFVLSASADISRPFTLASFKQLLFLILACIIMFVISRFDYHRLRVANTWPKTPLVYLLALSIALLVLVLLPRFGSEINYARRWFRLPLGPITVSFQPSELAKWALVFFLASICDKLSAELDNYWKRFIPICAIIALTAGLVLIEDFGTAALISLLAMLILIIAGVKFTYILTLLPAMIIGFCIALFTSPMRIRRIIAFIDPAKWAGSASYQANQSLIAIGSGRILGKGLAEGICKYGHLPEDTTDFIFAIIAEELGFVGTASVILLFIIFVWLGIAVIMQCKDRLGQLLAAAIVLTIGMQAAINIGVVTVVLPTKGIPLPFVSAGGTSLLLSAAAVGVLLNIAKQSNTEPGGKFDDN